jgi:hypothetical protein
MADTTKLSKNYKVSDYKDLIKKLDAAQPPNDGEFKAEIAKFFVERFTERYITPINAAGLGKHGFCTMAVSCLMIEALESFWNGWPDTDKEGRSGRNAFRQFFQRTPALSVFLGTDFYKNVRCGILHQAETTGGWTVNRRGRLLDGLSIDASKFHKAVEASLRDYAKLLEAEDHRNSERWTFFKKKMKHVCDNC